MNKDSQPALEVCTTGFLVLLFEKVVQVRDLVTDTKINVNVFRNAKTAIKMEPRSFLSGFATRALIFFSVVRTLISSSEDGLHVVHIIPCGTSIRCYAFLILQGSYSYLCHHCGAIRTHLLFLIHDPIHQDHTLVQHQG